MCCGSNRSSSRDVVAGMSGNGVIGDGGVWIGSHFDDGTALLRSVDGDLSSAFVARRVVVEPEDADMLSKGNSPLLCPSGGEMDEGSGLTRWSPSGFERPLSDAEEAVD